MISGFITGLRFLWNDFWTFFSRLLIPLLVTVLLISGILGMTLSGLENMDPNTKSTIALIANENGEALVQQFQDRKDIIIRTDFSENKLKKAIEDQEIEAALILAKDFDEALAQGRRAKATLMLNGRNSQFAASKINHEVNAYKQQILQQRLDSLDIKNQFIEPIDIQENDIFSPFGLVSKYFGGFIAFLFVLFVFLASIYPSLNLARDLKKISHAHFWGRMLSIIFISVLTLLITHYSLKYGLKLNPSVPAYINNVYQAMLGTEEILQSILFILPASLFFGMLLTGIGHLSKSFKRAQNTIQPLKLIVLFLLFTVLVPTMAFSTGIALFPFLDTAFSIRDMISGVSNSAIWIACGALVLYSILLFIPLKKVIGKDGVL